MQKLRQGHEVFVTVQFTCNFVVFSNGIYLLGNQLNIKRDLPFDWLG